MKTGAKLKQKRQEKGLTQKGLSELLGLSERAVISYERDETRPSDKVKIKYAEILEDSIEELFFKE